MRPRFDPWVGKIPWRKAWQPTPLFLPGEYHGQRSLVGYSPWGRKESDTTEWFSIHIIDGSQIMCIDIACVIFKPFHSCYADSMSQIRISRWIESEFLSRNLFCDPPQLGKAVLLPTFFFLILLLLFELDCLFHCRSLLMYFSVHGQFYIFFLSKINIFISLAFSLPPNSPSEVTFIYINISALL